MRLLPLRFAAAVRFALFPAGTSERRGVSLATKVRERVEQAGRPSSARVAGVRGLDRVCVRGERDAVPVLQAVRVRVCRGALGWERMGRTVAGVRVERLVLCVDAKVFKVALVDCNLVRLHRPRRAQVTRARSQPSPPRPRRLQVHAHSFAWGCSWLLSTMGDYEVTQYPSLLRPSLLAHPRLPHPH